MLGTIARDHVLQLAERLAAGGCGGAAAPCAVAGGMGARLRPGARRAGLAARAHRAEAGGAGLRRRRSLPAGGSRAPGARDRARGRAALLPDGHRRPPRSAPRSRSADRIRDGAAADGGLPAAAGRAVASCRGARSRRRRGRRRHGPAAPRSRPDPPARGCGTARASSVRPLPPARAPRTGRPSLPRSSCRARRASSRRIAYSSAARARLVRLALDPRSKFMRTPAVEEKLAQALSKHYGEPVRLEFTAVAAAGRDAGPGRPARLPGGGRVRAPRLRVRPRRPGLSRALRRDAAPRDHPAR